MSLYAAIANGVVLRLMVADSTPSTPSDCDAVDNVDSQDPLPQASWLTDYEGNYFIPSPVGQQTVQEMTLNTTQRDALPWPQGVIIFNTDTLTFQHCNDGSTWAECGF
jgi:hypothetical protein